jgi:protein phosphatase
MEENDKYLAISCLSDVGRKRENNEDSFLYIRLSGEDGHSGYLMAVADGMGGHQAGEVASRRLVDVLKEYVASNPVEDNNIPKLLKDAITEANRSIYETAGKTPELKGMGTTCTALVLARGRANIAHVGDSRAYLVRRYKARKLTKDHTVAERMMESGIMSTEEAKICPERNILLRAVGTNSDVEVDLVPPIDIIPGDVLVLCSDGLTEFVEEDEIAEIVNLYPPGRACEVMINIANNRGGTDNITALVVQVLGSSIGTSRIISGIKSLFDRIK